MRNFDTITTTATGHLNPYHKRSVNIIIISLLGMVRSEQLRLHCI